MKRLLGVATLLVALVLPASAAADPPVRELLPSGPITSEACGFEVLIEPIHEKFTLMTFPIGHSPVELLTGSSLVRVSSATNSVELNISGPSFLRELRDGTLVFSGAGPWLFFDHPFVNLPPLAYITGSISFSDDGPSIGVTGRVVDICALLS
jgi:hypothetical protein